MCVVLSHEGVLSYPNNKLYSNLGEQWNGFCVGILALHHRAYDLRITACQDENRGDWITTALHKHLNIGSSTENSNLPKALFFPWKQKPPSQHTCTAFQRRPSRPNEASTMFSPQNVSGYPSRYHLLCTIPYQTSPPHGNRQFPHCT
jgi:hypothetical protein